MNPNEITLSQHSVRQHPLRQQLYAEIHARPFPSIHSSVHARHFAFICNQTEAQEQLDLLHQIALEHQVSPPPNHSNCYYHKLKNYDLRWERHQEFCSLTFIQAISQQQPFEKNLMHDEQERLLKQFPGELVVALRVHLERDTEQPEPEALTKLFEQQQIYGSTIVGNKASMWSSFRLDSDDYARMLIYDKSLSDYQAGRTLQRVIEVETYRSLALLALPPARALMPKIAKLNNKLTKLVKKIRPDVNPGSDEHRLLDDVSKYAAQIEDYRSATTHRFSASNAYYHLVEQRLNDLREHSWPGYSSWKKMLQRRLIPAVETAISVARQLQNLSDQAERASNLLRTRVDMKIATQNQSLLQSLDRRSELQLRLQQMVEGLSVVAISYYFLSILKLVAEGIKKLGVSIEPSIVVAILALPVVLGTAWFIRRIRNKLHKSDSP